MTSRLTTLRTQLASLARARAGLRKASAWSALASSILIALAAAFVLDLVFDLAVAQRVVVLLLAAAAVGWAWWRFTRPLLGQREGEIETALFVERQQRIDSDLVAALQFESPEARSWGSPQLAEAVVERVADAGSRINVFEGLSREQAARRGGLLAGCLLVALIGGIASPGHLAAFANRLVLGSRHYPTRTRIERVVVNDTAVLMRSEQGGRPADSKAAQGRPLTFLVECSGQVPAGGTVYVTAEGVRGGGARLALKPLAQDERQRTTVLSGELGRLHDDVTYRIVAGDAHTDLARVQMIRLPIIEVETTATPPKYAAASAPKTDTSGRQLAVLEGSAVEMAVKCTNGKPLEAAWLTLINSRGTERIDLVPNDADRTVWSPKLGESPLAHLRQEARYEVQVIDADGLSLETPIRGTIRIRPDQPPTGASELIHKVVLPTANPVVAYRVSDDYGISRLAIVVDVERGGARPPVPTDADDSRGGEGQIAPAAAAPSESQRYEVFASKEPIAGDRLPLAGSYALALAPLKLAKGDRLKLTLEVTDYRGENEGRATGTAELCDPLVLEISDESGVLAAISQPDQRSADQLSEIIKRQLGIGEER